MQTVVCENVCGTHHREVILQIKRYHARNEKRKRSTKIAVIFTTLVDLYNRDYVNYFLVRLTPVKSIWSEKQISYTVLISRSVLYVKVIFDWPIK